jgi:hypothetical protein
VLFLASYLRLLFQPHSGKGLPHVRLGGINAESKIDLCRNALSIGYFLAAKL